MSIVIIVFAVTAIVLVILLLHEVARCALTLILNLAHRLPGTVTVSQIWTRSDVFRSRLVKRYPTLFQFIRTRIDPQQSTGLPLTLMIVAALYLAALFSGLTEDILEAEGTMYVDNLVNAAFAPWRVEPLVSGFPLDHGLGKQSVSCFHRHHSNWVSLVSVALSRYRGAVGDLSGRSRHNVGR